MRLERRAAKFIWLACGAVSAALAAILVAYFTGGAVATRIPEYESSTSRSTPTAEDPVGEFGQYQRLHQYFPQDVIKRPEVVPEAGLDTYIEVTKVFVENTRVRACKLRQLRPFPGGQQATSEFFREGDNLPDNVTAVKEIRADGVLFKREGRDDVFLPVKP